MPKTTKPLPTDAPLSATEIARRAARSGPADAYTSAGFAEQGDVGNAPILGGANVIVPSAEVEIRALAPEVRVTLPRRLETDPGYQAITLARAEAMADALIIASPADLGRLVRKVREGRRLLQLDFADLAGVGRRFLSELENGKPTLELGKVLKVTNAAGLTLLARER